MRLKFKEYMSNGCGEMNSFSIYVIRPVNYIASSAAPGLDKWTRGKRACGSMGPILPMFPVEEPKKHRFVLCG